MLKLNLGEESTLWHALSLWDSLSKIRYQISKQMHYILCIIEKKVLIVKNRICFEPAHTQKVIVIKTGFTCIKKGFSKKKVYFFFKENKRKEKLFFQPVLGIIVSSGHDS